MNGTTSWLGDRIASFVPNLLPQTVAYASGNCWLSCVDYDQWQCCVEPSGSIYCHIIANCL